MAPFKVQHPKNRELNGGDLVAQSLKNLGVEVAFGLHGGQLDAFLLAAHECGNKLIDTRHETTAVQAAEGYTRYQARLEFASYCNGLPGLASAFADRSPIFCVTSSPPLQDAETNALQGFHDQVVVAKPITKFAHRVTNVDEIPRIVAYAYRAANTGIKGPVLIDLPIDILFSPPQFDRIAYGAIDVPAVDPPAPNSATVDRLIEAWKGARRPVIITGTGARGTDEALLGLAETTNTPTFYSNKFSSPIPNHHELRGGPATGLAAMAGKEQADFVLLLAGRTGFLLGGRGGAIIPKTATLAQVDLDGAEIGKTHPIDIGIISDAKLFCQTFIDKASNISFPHNSEWIKKCRNLTTSPPLYEQDPKVQPDGHLHPYHAMSALMNSLPSDSIIMIDGGEAGQWAAMTAEQANAKHILTPPGYLGFLGNGWGYSLGVAIADPSRLVVNIHGDGSAGFHIQELDIMARSGLKILTVVANNYVWGMSVNGQDLIYDGITETRPCVKMSEGCRDDIVAQGFGCEGEKVEKFEDIGPVVEELSRKTPALINMIVSVKPTTPASLSMVGETADPNVIVVPYYDNVPRPYYKSSQKNGQTNSTS
ncbi:hypothetical protein DOTSEDRAFT_29894 [Dothistroma septosporum NZE10]|uniref:Uncharacterized protein n=1 Tax=Dothistroma septosporum (strain NZE10 / CBS 128990) TaxID=675120 RepID=N1Q1D6_DOTSN|nr:hypothetical protein DOTSEDRAFT_29894 [Dothistroma septosporum NZE10]